MESVAQFPVSIADDDIDEPEESFFISYEPLNNGLVIPPITEVKICGGEYYTYSVIMPEVDQITNSNCIYVITYSLTRTNTDNILCVTNSPPPCRTGSF